MANKKSKQTTAPAPKATRRRKPGWVRRTAGWVFASVVAPVVVGIAVQSFQAFLNQSLTKAAPAQPVKVAPAGGARGY